MKLTVVGLWNAAGRLGLDNGGGMGVSTHSQIRRRKARAGIFKWSERCWSTPNTG